nr:MAG TPA: hypothetical protein [Caudoviricetes sp.]DAV03025.1 MAG TPA: hypothetical protein [Caudoviricetes sp.]
MLSICSLCQNTLNRMYFDINAVFPAVTHKQCLLYPCNPWACPIFP